jgi:serine/threonine protein kinase
MMTAPTPADEAERRAPVDERPRSLAGEVVEGRYRVVERIGSGGMGAVYRVEHLNLQRHFALKLLRPELTDEPGMLQRFEREARLAASVKSEHVVTIVDAGKSSTGTPYFVMELGDSDLRRLLRAEGPLTPVRTANLGIDTCRGLAAAHDKGLVHRDLKPENLLLGCGDDGREIAKIADFGVAKALGAHSTQPGSLIGTVRYMAPEQVGLNEPVGPATDIYALGVILYECLTGAVPFEEETTERTLYRIMTDTPEPLRARCPDLPHGLAAAIDRALERAPAARHASARAFAEALLPFAGTRSKGASAGVLFATDSERADSDTAPNLRTLPFDTAVNAADSSGAVARRWPRTALIVLASAAAGAALATLATPENASRPETASAPTVTATTAPPSASLPAPENGERERPLAVPPAFETGSPAPEQRPPRAAPALPTVKGPRAKPSSSAIEPPPRRHPPSASFDPANPYGP